MAVEEKAKKINKTSEPKKGFLQFFKELKAEFKRITWASKEEVKNSTVTVLSFCLLYVVIVGLLDFGFNNLVKVILK